METSNVIPQPRRLTRPLADRWLGGVCSGLGAYFDLSPAIYRIAFVALTLAGGTGVILYAAAWLVIPEEGADESIASATLKERRAHPGRLLGLGVLGFVFIIAISHARVWPGTGDLWLIVALAVAALLWWRLSPLRVARAVGIFTVLLLVAAIAIPLATIRVPLFNGIGHRAIVPANASQLYSQYSLGMGKLTIDLTGMPVPRGQTFVKATVGIGDLDVIVPANATVDVKGRADAGDVQLLDQNQGGFHTTSRVIDRTGSGRVLVLDLHTGYGKVEVQRG
jgi:phage shock protein PspC (stress-responsive transcriptional regulator)